MATSPGRGVAGERAKSTTPSTRLETRTPGKTPRARQYRLVGPHMVGQALTPHSIRALQQRRQAALTPSRNRRASINQHRETPRDILRKLSRVLAPQTALARRESDRGGKKRAGNARSEHHDDDVEEELSELADPPRPRSSFIPDDADPTTSTVSAGKRTSGRRPSAQPEESPEAARRAMTSQMLQRKSRGSFSVPDRLLDSPDFTIGSIPDAFENSYVPHQEEGADESIVPQDMDITGNDESRRISLPQSPPSPPDLSPAGQSAMDFGAADDTFAFEVPLEAEPRRDSDQGALQQDLADYSVGHSSSEAGQEHLDQTRVGGDQAPSAKGDSRARRKRMSRHGLPYPALTSGVVKKFMNSLPRQNWARGRSMGKETVAEIARVSDWFFEQVADDLSAYADHAGRKTIAEADVSILMRRQRLLTESSTVFSVACKLLPGELLRGVRMTEPASRHPKPKGRSKASSG